MKKKRRLLIIVILLIVFGMNIGYSYVTTNLTLKGTLNTAGNKWDVHFENIKVSSGSVEATSAPTITDDTKISYAVTLSNYGEYYEFTFDVVNEGTIDAMVGDMTFGTLSDNQKKYLTYKVTYSDGTEINKNDLLENSTGKEKIKVRVELNSDASEEDLPETTDAFDLDIDMNYIQNKGGTKVNHVMMTLNDTDNDGVADVGEKITIGTETFYVISNDGENIKALSEYNLYVGNIYDGSAMTAIDANGIQDESAKGWQLSGTPYVGVQRFATSQYWDSSEGTTIELNNSKNMLYTYLTNYKTYLNNNNGNVSDVSLITKAELESLNCVGSGSSCYSAPSWVYTTTYWTKTVYDGEYIWCVNSNGSFGYYNLNYDAVPGVRPVVTIKSSLIKTE